ncbi:specifically androgen-regulated gene protein [Tachyglossus aculeatus]|uniref:specifically androgen-regulated gene protein n=1 Tax=Tachyglossus aculeatus TaxID=9261 RepID=UPI0018F406EE|nr:specifically androgen-regulated gene protein [Tachyglossus aculeatus]
MPEKELWPAGPGTDPVTRVGSSDSMTSADSTQSGFSDGSYDFLSAEEKECLLFLEETIGSLDREADGGLSTDESEQALTPRARRPQPIGLSTPQGHLEGSIQGPTQKSLQPSSLQPPELKSGSHSLPRNIHISRVQKASESSTPKPQSSVTGPPPAVPRVPLLGPPESHGVNRSHPAVPESPSELDLVVIPPPVAFRDPHLEQESLLSGQLREGDERAGQGRTEVKAQENLVPWPQNPPARREEAISQLMAHRTKQEDLEGTPGLLLPPPGFSTETMGPENSPSEHEGDLRPHPGPPTAQKPRKLPPNIILKASRGSFHTDPQNRLSHRPEFSHGDLAPERSSPAHLALQEQRRARREALEKLGLPQDQDSEPNHPRSKPTSSPLAQPPASALAAVSTSPLARDPSPTPPVSRPLAPSAPLARAPSPTPPVTLHPTLTAQSSTPDSPLTQPPAPSAPLARAPTQTPPVARPLAPTAPLARAPSPSPHPVHPPTPALIRAASPPSARAPTPGLTQTPAPAQPRAPPSKPVPIHKDARVESPPARPKPDRSLALSEGPVPGLRQLNFKSNTLERSGVGLSSYLSAEKDAGPKTSSSLGKVSFLDKLSPSILRNTRPRPASLGTGSDFAGIQVGKMADVEQERNEKRLSYPLQSRSKLPRPPCVSVRITPKGATDEHRREALKKLGLLKE